jgi:hypothetical protein
MEKRHKLPSAMPILSNLISFSIVYQENPNSYHHPDMERPLASHHMWMFCCFTARGKAFNIFYPS